VTALFVFNVLGIKSMADQNAAPKKEYPRHV
jgi:hypothetical protein